MVLIILLIIVLMLVRENVTGEMFNEREYCKTATSGYEIPETEHLVIETDGMNEQHVGVLKAFTDHILFGTPLVAEGPEGITGLMLSNAMYLSSWLDQTVELPVDEDRFLEELNKHRATGKKVN